MNRLRGSLERPFGFLAGFDRFWLSGSFEVAGYKLVVLVFCLQVDVLVLCNSFEIVCLCWRQFAMFEQCYSLCELVFL